MQGNMGGKFLLPMFLCTKIKLERLAYIGIYAYTKKGNIRFPCISPPFCLMFFGKCIYSKSLKNCPFLKK